MLVLWVRRVLSEPGLGQDSAATSLPLLDPFGGEGGPQLQVGPASTSGVAPARVTSAPRAVLALGRTVLFGGALSRGVGGSFAGLCPPLLSCPRPIDRVFPSASETSFNTSFWVGLLVMNSFSFLISEKVIPAPPFFTGRGEGFFTGCGILSCIFFFFFFATPAAYGHSWARD